MSDRDNILVLNHVSKKFVIDGTEKNVLKDVSIALKKGEILCLLGHSGCGKSTLLRIIAGMLPANEGEVLFQNSKHEKPTKDVLLLFQDFNQLFPWMTIKKNIIHALKKTGRVKNKKDANDMAMRVLREVGLEGFENSYPCQLSGGMKQRAAVARVLAVHPKVLLMDEALASLDYSTRHKLQRLVREKAHEYGISVLFVTHGVEEAVLVGDRIAVMKPNPGEIGEIWDNPYIVTKNNMDKMRLMTYIMEYMDKIYA